MKAIHIHTDLKFVFETQKFEGNYFENLVIIINNQHNYDGPYKESARFFNYGPGAVKKIVGLCKTGDLVILYDLDTIKCQIAIKLPPTIMIAWRFFGYELYKVDARQYLSSLTLKANHLTHLQKLKEFIRRKYNQAISILVWGNSSEQQFKKALRRIDIFLGTSLEEYNNLKERWSELPNYVKIPFSRVYATESQTNIKEKLFILGNNRSVYNNHLDIIDIINASSKQDHYKIVLVYNYGPENNYSRCVRAAVRDNKNYSCLEEFIPYKEFRMLYQRAGAAIFNGYRQMALGNIFLALGQGVKVYLNRRNIVMRWLQNEGFKIYPVDDLAFDIENDNTFLPASDAQHNVELLNKFQNSYNKVHFQQMISSLIQEKAYTDK